MYERKILLVNEYDGTFTARGKTLGGVVKFLCDGAATKMSLSLSNIDTMRMGNWYVYVFADGKYFMFEPTETESVETLDRACEIMLEIRQKAFEDGAELHNCPTTTIIGRADEVNAARNPVLKYEFAD